MSNIIKVPGDKSVEQFRQHLYHLALSTRLDNNIGLFPADSEFRKLSLMPSTFFGAARALLLQVAHPVVAQGVHDHSQFDTNPSKRAIHTFVGVFAISLGRQQFALDIAEHVFRAHIPIKGKIPAYGNKPERMYSAMDPEANLWVWATLIEGILFGHQEVGYQPERKRLEAMYQEAKIFGQFFNVREKYIPKTLEDFEVYFQDVLSNKLEVTPAGQAVADALLSGAKFPYTLFSGLFTALAVESLPENICAAYGWKKTKASGRIYGSLRSIAKLQNSLTPEFLKPVAAVWYPVLRRKLGGEGKALHLAHNP